jgi:hypothetical protein
VNFSAFNSTYEVDTPLCSSKELSAYYKSRAKSAKATRAGPRKITRAGAPQPPPPGLGSYPIRPTQGGRTLGTISGSPATPQQERNDQRAAAAAVARQYGSGYQDQQGQERNFPKWELFTKQLVEVNLRLHWTTETF